MNVDDDAPNQHPKSIVGEFRFSFERKSTSFIRYLLLPAFHFSKESDAKSYSMAKKHDSLLAT